jgi:uncharacterized protein (TIGR00255 family)
MTGYAERCFDVQDYTVFIGIKSLNNKFFDVRFRLPFYLEFLEERFKKIVKTYVKRGKVEVLIHLTAKEQREYEYIKSMIEKYQLFIHRIESETSKKLRVSLSDLIALKELMGPLEENDKPEINEEKLKKMFIETVEAFQESRRIEGEFTKDDIFRNIREMISSADRIEETYPAVVERHKNQLKDRIHDLLNGQIDETRLLMEVGIYANKIDINEEISRIRGHIQTMMGVMQSNDACGRELDFIIQELTREINTIGAKVPDFTVSEGVVRVKTCLEKIKEQVRNIE